MAILTNKLMDALEAIKPQEAYALAYDAAYASGCGCTGDCGQSCRGGCEVRCTGDCGRSCSGSCS